MTKIHGSPACTPGAAWSAAAVPRAAPHDLGGRAWSAADRWRCRARPCSPITACCSSTSCRSSRGRPWRRCAQPLEDGRVTDRPRASSTAVYPSRFMLVAATNPCPCGYAGDAAALPLLRGRAGAPPARAQRPAARPDRPRRPGVARRRRRAARAAAGRARARCRAACWARDRQAARLRGTGVSCNADSTSRCSAATRPRSTAGRGAAARAYVAARSASAATRACCGWRARSPTSTTARRCGRATWRRRSRCTPGPARAAADR